MARIDRLTPAQEARLSEYRDHWLAVGLSTEPANRAVAESGVDAAYVAAGMSPPPIKIWLDSPMGGALGAHFLSQVESQVESQVRSQVRSQVWSQVWSQVESQVESQVRSQVWSQVESQVWSQVESQVRSQVWSQVWSQVESQVESQVDKCGYGQHDASWLAFYAFFRDECVIECCKKLRGIEAISLASSWWWPFAGLVILTDRPLSISHNERCDLHSESGPALAYRDGFSLWRIDGVAVDEQIVLAPETQTIKQIDGEQNNDVKAVRINRFGWPRYLRETNATCLNERKNHIEGTREALYRTKDGTQRLVVVCPTGRIFALGVADDVATCEQAQRYLAGDTEGMLNCIART